LDRAFLIATEHQINKQTHSVSEDGNWCDFRSQFRQSPSHLYNTFLCVVWPNDDSVKIMYIISIPSMNRSIIVIMDLQHQMICTILDNPNNMDVLYSFIDINKWFDKLLRDSIYARSIQLRQNNEYCSLPDAIIERFFFVDILPRIDQCLVLVYVSSLLQRSVRILFYVTLLIIFICSLFIIRKIKNYSFFRWIITNKHFQKQYNTSHSHNS
jgi:hypothetical protein